MPCSGVFVREASLKAFMGVLESSWFDLHGIIGGRGSPIRCRRYTGSGKEFFPPV
jgi:hypothetical protein